MLKRLASFATVMLLTGCGGATEAQPDDAWRREAEEFRAAHEESYRNNWSTIAGLHFISRGTHTAGSASSNDVVLPSSVPTVVGRFVYEGDTVRFEPEPGVTTMRGKVAVTGPIEMVDTSQSGTTRLSWGTVALVVHRSGDRRAIRVWDPDGELARGFLGFSWFPLQADYRVTGRFIRDAEPRTLPVLNTFGDADLMRTEGVVEFTLRGRTLRLRPFTTDAGRLWFVFKDESSGEETYEAARFLYSDLNEDGSVVLDFNQAYNPPCAFNPYTTCPIPLPENRLPIKVLAGERDYPVHPAPPTS